MATKKKKGLSAEEKRKVILHIYHEKKEPFNLKEIESLASKQGVVQQTVKDMNQSLVDDFLVFSDKIGAANFFWSFPSKEFQDQTVRKTGLEASLRNTDVNIANITTQIETARESRSANNRVKLLHELESLKQLEGQLDNQLEELKVNDPDEICRVEKLALANKTAADRWTDNIWQIKSYLTKRKGMAGKEVDKMLRIDSEFDYVEYQPANPNKKAGNKTQRVG